MMCHIYAFASRTMSVSALLLLFAALVAGVAQNALGDDCCCFDSTKICGGGDWTQCASCAPDYDGGNGACTGSGEVEHEGDPPGCEATNGNCADCGCVAANPEDVGTWGLCACYKSNT